ncbi:MAG: peptidoglycan DD-metalloendopeptidase family protein [Prolixibacteraceae bacterium]|nr:peptidoglycan DD-metalloendopeptidase family protein [Prolixibacteraceae bacterium]
MKFKIPEKYQRLKRILIWVVSFIVLLQIAYFVYDQYETKRIMEELAKEKEVVKPEPVMLFNIPIDSFQVVPGQIRSGQNLSDILVKQGISMSQIDEISKKSILTFDVRKMKINNNYYFFMNKKAATKVEYFIYEINPVDYVVYDLSDSLRIYKEKKPIITQIKTASGVITSSLWKTMESQALNTDLAMVLANNIYAWSIDFYGIQKGDKFRIVYEENFVYGKSIGVGRVFASEFVHAGKSYSAFLFTQKNKNGTDEDSYFDSQGKSLVKAFLKAPLEFSRISSKFSNARFHPVLKIYRPHHGVDYAAPTGTPVRSIGDGTIVAKGYQASGGGNFLKVKHNSAYLTSYMHLSKFGNGISVGTHVSQGQVIGFVGSTGLSSGPHLDFRVFLNGNPINPLDMKAPDGDPVNKDRMKDYTLNRDTLMVKLNAIKNF